MQLARTYRILSLAVVASLLPALAGICAGTRAPGTSAQPRVLLLPWLVVDRTTNRELARPERGAEPGTDEARLLGRSGQAALDGALHKQGLVDLIPRAEWEPYTTQATSDGLFWAGSGCAVCASSGQLLRYDRSKIRMLGRAAHADYIWLGVVVAPVTWQPAARGSAECCREALALDREVVLARSTAVLVRVSDGETVWERDARWPDPRQKSRKYPIRYGLPDMPRTDSGHEMGNTGPEAATLSPYFQREKAVDATARELANAFRRDYLHIVPGGGNS